MKVAYVTGFYNGKIDGRLGRFHDWVHRLRDMDNPPFEHEIHAFSAVNPDNTLASQPHSMLGDGDRLWGKRTNNIEYLINAPRVYADLQRSDFDVLHILQLNPVVYLTGILNQNQPTVIGPDILGWNPVRSGGRWNTRFPDSLLPKTKYMFKQLVAYLQQYDAGIVYSNYHRQMLSEIGIDDSKISCILPGISPRFCTTSRRATQTNEPPELLYVGDLSRHKGFPVFVEAIKKIQKDVRVTVIGAGETDTLKNEQLPQLTAKGFVDRGDLPRYYQRADLYVMPSIDEAGPNTILEALACGTPVVATDKVGINEFPPSDSAIFFWPREANQLATAIETALGRLPRLTAAARSHAADFHVDRTIDCLEELYNKLIKEK